MQADVEFPDKLQFLFDPGRYKVLYGGRGGAKSWSVARALLIQGVQSPLRVLCARELQGSILDSVHKLLSDQITVLGLEHFYAVQKTTILGANGTEFLFAGLRNNIHSIRSKEGIDRVWVEEANLVSKVSWDTLIPTIRKDGSEIWITFNPDLDTDVTWQRFVLHPPASAVVCKIGWQDNPWFPGVLADEKTDLENRDPDAALVVWGGFTRQVLDGAIYANELRAVMAEGRISRVPYEQSKPVHTFWDLGRSDKTCIWFAQVIGFEFHLIDYYENAGFVLTHYLKHLQTKPYVYGDNWLPHDATHELLASAMTVEQQMRAAGFKVRITPRTTINDGINATRTIFGKCWFDAEKCADGLEVLRHYRYAMDIDAVTRKREPLHDWASHGSDALRYMAVALKDARPKPADHGPRHVPYDRGGNTAWMGM